MTALEELRAGELGDEFVHLLYRTVAVVARARNFPPPSEHAVWTADAVIATTHDFLVSTNAQRRLTELAAASADDASFERLLSATVLNFLREGGRRTTLGKLIRRLRVLLDADPRFHTVPDGGPGAGNVMLEGSDTSGYAGEPADLLRAAHRVRDISIVRWSPSARREGPVAEADSLLNICESVLVAAGASLPLPELAGVVADRLGLNPRNVPMAIAVDDLDSYRSIAVHRGRGGDTKEAGPGGPGVADPGSAVLDDEVAAILEELTDRDVLVLAWLHETVRVIADRSGLAVSTAGDAKQRLSEKLRLMLSGESAERADVVALAARDAARDRLGLEPL